MNRKIFYKILDFILEKTVIEIPNIKNQREFLNIDKIEIFDNNKYAMFCFNTNMDNVKPVSFSFVSIMFWEFTQNIPIDCILHFRNGYIHSLEVYSCNGNPFETINLNNIDIKQLTTSPAQ